MAMKLFIFLVITVFGAQCFGQDILTDPTLRERERDRIGIVYGAEIPATSKLGFSQNVKRVKELDSLEGTIITYTFNRKGYLVKENHNGKRYSIERVWNYEGENLISTSDSFNNKYDNVLKKKNYYYIGSRLNKIKEIHADTQIRYEISEGYIYRNDSLISIIRKGSDKEETEEFLYNKTVGPQRIKRTKTKGFEILMEEFRNNDTILINTYNKEDNTTIADKYVYNSQNNLLKHVIYYDDEVFHSKINRYKDSQLLSQEIFYADSGTEEYFYDMKGNIEKMKKHNKTYIYLYDYNALGDVIKRKFMYDGKVKNVWYYEIEYWE